MKHSVRPLLLICLITITAATLTFRILLQHHGPAHFETYPPFLPKPITKKPTFNTTLLNLASIDVGQPKLNQEIDQLLEGNFQNHARHRSFLSSGRYHVDIRAKLYRGIPVHLSSPQFYRLWLDFRRYLQTWSRNRRFKSDIMLDLVNVFKGQIYKYNGVKGLERKYKTCAVVGNSGILLKSEYGELIDGHEVVIRLNNARISSFERNVGSKTNISFVNSNILHLCARRERCACHPYGLDVPMIMYICQAVHFLDYAWCNSSHRVSLVITDPRFDVLCSRVVKYYSLKRFVEVTGKSAEEWGSAHDGVNFHYSSGMQAVMLAVGICEKVSVFGFGKTNSAKHHYHTNQKTELSLHDYEAEYDLYRDLVERPVIPFVSDKFKFPPVVIYQ